MSRFFIHRPIFAMVISLVIVIAGAVSLFSLPVAQYPQISPPTVTVETFYTGASAKVVEENVAVPIEQEVNGAENMIYMSSTSTSDGRYYLTCTFAVGTDLDIAQVDVQNRVSRAEKSLPQEVKNYGITTKKASPDMLMVLSLFSPGGTYDDLFLSNYARINLYDPIARIYGVGNISIVGEREYAMRMWVRPDKLAKLGLTASDIAKAVQDQNVQAPAGQVGQPPASAGVSFQYTVDVKGRLSDKEEFDDVIIRTLPDGSILRIRDVARTEMGAKMYTSYSRRAGKPSTTMVIYQLPGANALDVANQIRAFMGEAQKRFPPGLEYEVSYDNTQFVRAALTEVVKTFFEALILVILVVFIFLGSFRATLIPCLAIPVSLVGTFAAFVVLGFSVNTLSMFGLVLAIGVVVDDAIVVVEAVETNMGRGLEVVEATEKAMEEVTSPVIGTTCVLISVFVPVAFLGGITGQLYRQFALTLAVSVALSSMVALSLTPALCVKILRPRKEMRGPLGAFFRWFNRVFARSTEGYLKGVRAFMRRLVLVLVLLVAFYLGTGGLFKILPGGFVPDEDQGVIFVTFNLPPGASLERTQTVLTKAEQFAGKEAGIKTVLSWGGFNLMTGTYTSDAGSLVLTLDPWEERSSRETQIVSIMQRLRREYMGYPEARVFVYTLPSIPGMGNVSGFQYQLQDRSAKTPEELYQTAQDMVAAARQDPAIASLFNNFQVNVPQIKLDIDRDKVKTLGIPLQDVFNALQLNLGGYMINDFNRYGRVYKVMAQAEPEFRQNPEDIRNIFVRTTDDRMVPLSTLVKISNQSGPILIKRYNMFRTAELSGQAAPGYSSGDAIAAMERLSEKLPRGFGYEWTGLAYQEKLASGQAGPIFAFALVFVFLVLAALYESWAIPFGVLLGLPVAVFGALFGVWLRGLANDVYVQIGIVMLIGLSAKTAILIVEFAKNKREVEGLGAFDAALQGAHLRFRAILMTAFSFILGVTPLVVASGAGAASRWSLGTAVFAGMTAATILVVFFTPALYYAIEILLEKKKGRRGAPTPAPTPTQASQPQPGQSRGEEGGGS
ncbi:MAG: multidrug efflux RND transporter permease subunit [Syntrophobacterales bacterium]